MLELYNQVISKSRLRTNSYAELGLCTRPRIYCQLFSGMSSERYNRSRLREAIRIGTYFKRDLPDIKRQLLDEPYIVPVQFSDASPAAVRVTRKRKSVIPTVLNSFQHSSIDVTWYWLDFCANDGTSKLRMYVKTGKRDRVFLWHASRKRQLLAVLTVPFQIVQYRIL